VLYRKQKLLFLTALWKLRRPRSRAQYDFDEELEWADEGPLPGSLMAVFLLCPLMAGD
jgi:hypothetical protein